MHFKSEVSNIEMKTTRHNKLFSFSTLIFLFLLHIIFIIIIFYHELGLIGAPNCLVFLWQSQFMSTNFRDGFCTERRYNM